MLGKCSTLTVAVPLSLLLEELVAHLTGSISYHRQGSVLLQESNSV